MQVAMDTTETSGKTSPDPLASGYHELYERSAIDAAFLWLFRCIAVHQPHYYIADLIDLDKRIEARLDLLMSSQDLGWEACEAALESQQPGEVFTAAVVALRSHDIGKIQTAIESGIKLPSTFRGLTSAFGWLPREIARPWMERLLKGKDMNHKYLGIAAASVRREDPSEILNEILKREDCRKHIPLHARALRLVGELRRQDLMPAVQASLNSKEPEVVFWANWAGILLGQHALAANLRPAVLKPGPFQSRAIQLALRVLPIEQGREWISALTKDPANVRAVITATGVLGDPHAVNWLITKMAEPALARLAGEAFSMITGVELEKHGLIPEVVPKLVAIPNDDPLDNFVGLDEDENLPWPDPEKIAALWRNYGQHFLVGRRYFSGKTISPDWLRNRLQEGSQRVRHGAALELALVDTQSRLVNTRARAGA